MPDEMQLALCLIKFEQPLTRAEGGFQTHFRQGPIIPLAGFRQLESSPAQTE